MPAKKSSRPVPKKTNSATKKTVRKVATSRVQQKLNPTSTLALPPAKSFADNIADYKKQLHGDHVFVLNMPFEDRAFGQTIGARWHPQLRQWMFISPRLDYHMSNGQTLNLSHYKAPEFSLEKWIEDELNGTIQIPKYPQAMTPRPHQLEAIKKIRNAAKAGYRGFLNADSTGLGKSLASLLGAYGVAQLKGFTPQNPAKLLIICPKAVIPHWRNTIRASGVDNMRIVVVNYDQAKKLLDIPPTAEEAKRQRTKNQRTALHGNPTIKWDIIISDESHKLKNAGTQRINSFNRIARYVEKADKAPFVIWASATIGQNPIELGYLAPLISQLSGEQGITVKEFGAWLISHGYHVKTGTADSYAWLKIRSDMSDEQKAEIENLQTEDITRLAQLLFSPQAPSIRRNPEDLVGWPTQTHIPMPIELNAGEEAEYAKLWTEFRQAMKLQPRGKNPASGLAATLRFRQKAYLLTASYTADYAEELLENGFQVAISVQFMETIDLLKAKLEKAGYTIAEFSGRNETNREQERLKFQRGEADVIIFTTEEGVSFHANEQLPDGSHATNNKRATIVHDMRYSGIALTQILGRATRDGELSNAYYMYSSGTIEEKILETMLRRVRNVKALSGDDESTTQDIYDILDGLK